MDAYKRVLARPGVRALVVTMLLARIPVAAASIVLTLHVVLGSSQGGLGLNYAAAGVVGATVALASGVGSPLIGRLIDRVGLIPVITLTMSVQIVFWATARYLSYDWLLLGAAGSGLLALPVHIVARQSLAVLLPDSERQAGFALDSMSVEVSFAVGPAAGAAVITQWGSNVTFIGLAVAFAASGLATIVLNPPVAAERAINEAAVRLRSWLDARVVAVLIVTAGGTITLAGTDVTITAMMRNFHEIRFVGIVISVWCLGSLVGGFVYGMMHRRVPPLLLLVLLAALTLPVGLAPNWWSVALLLIPTAVFCAPLISATVDRLIGLTPPSERGVAMGAHASALTFGVALGAPLAGLVIDASSAPFGFVGVGVAALALAAVAGLILRRTQPQVIAPTVLSRT